MSSLIVQLCTSAPMPIGTMRSVSVSELRSMYQVCLAMSLNTPLFNTISLVQIQTSLNFKMLFTFCQPSHLQWHNKVIFFWRKKGKASNYIYRLFLDFKITWETSRKLQLIVNISLMNCRCIQCIAAFVCRYEVDFQDSLQPGIFLSQQDEKYDLLISRLSLSFFWCFSK